MLFLNIGVGLLLGLLIGTVLYIIGGYFLPFLVYSIFMLVLVPFGAKLIPDKPAAVKATNNNTNKICDDDLEIKIEGYDEHNKANVKNDSHIQNSNSTKHRRINPFKIVYRLFKNKVRELIKLFF